MATSRWEHGQELACHAEEGDVRVVGMTNIANWETGNLELFFEGSWGQVCAAGFVGPDAAVACRQLGYTAGASIPFYAVATFAPERYMHLNLTCPICYTYSVDLSLCILRRGAVTCRTAEVCGC